MKPRHIQNMDSRLKGIVVRVGAADGSADADLKNMITLHQSLFDRPANRRAVVEPLSPSLVGSIGVSIELDDCEPRVFSIRRAQDGQQDGMITTQRHDRRASLLKFANPRFDFVKCLSVIKRVDSDVTNVGGAQTLVNAHLHLLTVITTADRALPDGVRTKSGPRTVSHHTIERNAQHRQIKFLIIDPGIMRQTTERGDPTKRRLRA